MKTKSTQTKANHQNQPTRRRTWRFVLLCAGLLGLGSLLLIHDVSIASASRQLLQWSVPTTLPLRPSARADKVSPDGLWQEVDQAAIASTPDLQMSPQSYARVHLNQDALVRLLAQAPMEFTERARDAVEMTLPMPDGQFARFSVVESPIMAPGLAAEYPDIKTYRGQGIDDPTATTRFDWTPAGFHAMVLSEHKTVFVDPTADGEIENYRSVTKDDLPRENFADSVVNDESKTERQSSGAQTDIIKPAVTNGAKLRVYRMAVAATFEYTTAAGGTKAGALARITTTMNRLNGIFEREIAIRMVLIADENKIIFDTAAQSPYKDGDTFAMLAQNQTTLDQIIGTANYDIGHVFGAKGGGGVGRLFAVCSDGNKASGASASQNPTSDSFASSLVAQEVMHQFSGRHTFNGTTSNCGGTNRDEAAAYEPGSGSTIGSYAGICGDQNLQTASDDYFHVKNLEEMFAFVNGDGNCAQQQDTGNTPPTINAGANFTIPRNTPFTLSATGNDPDPGDNDRLTFAWEEYDKGPASPPDNDADGQARPIFRTFAPTKSPSRTFPRIDRLVANPAQPPATYNCTAPPFLPINCITGETLPSIARTMNFQVTARDTRGGINSATMQVTVDGNSGPFLVTAPAAGTAWLPGSTQAVTWNVANTNNAPVNAANVKISLSTDGGQTFPTVLADNVPNTGTANVTLPNAPAPNSVIKVEAIGNIFFSISPKFLIRPNCGAITLAPATLPDIRVLFNYDQTVTATGGTGAVTYAVTAGQLPFAVQLDPATGKLTGPPQQAGTSNFTITATDTVGCTAVQAYVLNVLPDAAIDNAGAQAPPGGGKRVPGKPQVVTNATFHVTLDAPSDKTISMHYTTVDGTAKAGIDYTAVSGTLDFLPGVTMQTITVPILAATHQRDTFKVELSQADNVFIEDGEGEGDIVESDNSSCPAITLNPASLPPGTVGVAYQQTLTASGGSGPLVFEVDGGDLPPGLNLNEDTGALTGMPLFAGTFNVKLAAVDANLCPGSRSYSMTIARPAAAITGISPASGKVGTAVTLAGRSFTGATAVRFNGVAVTNFTVNADGMITTSVPPGATSGSISVNTPIGVATSASAFSIINSPPVVSDTLIVTRQNTPINGRLAAVDNDNDSLTFRLVPLTDPSIGLVTLDNSATGDFTYTPAANFVGVDSFQYSASDGKDGSNTGKVTVIVNSGQTPVVAGMVTTSSSAPLGGVTIFLNGSKLRTTITDENGFYEFDKVDAGPQAVTPLLANFAFNPGGRSITVTGDQTNLTFTGTRNPVATSNAIDAAEFFVRQNYLDFLDREPDQSGFDFWTNNIRSCTPQPSCTEILRINTSAAYFLSIEFQQTGYLAERFYKAAYGDATGTSTVGGAHQIAVPIVRFEEFEADLGLLRAGLVVGQTGWETVLENNKQAFANGFVRRFRFSSAYATTLTPAQFVDQLFAKTGVTPSATDRNAAIAEFGSATNTSDLAARARALRRVAENSSFIAQEFNRAFVLAQFFGYLRRDPNAVPDKDYSGFEFWLIKLNQFNGNYINAEMVKAFINSAEYRRRFGP